MLLGLKRLAKWFGVVMCGVLLDGAWLHGSTYNKRKSIGCDLATPCFKIEASKVETKTRCTVQSIQCRAISRSLENAIGEPERYDSEASRYRYVGAFIFILASMFLFFDFSMTLLH